MSPMVRKQIYIEPRQEQLLKRRAKDLGITEAELIRRGLDQVVRVPSGWLPDLEAWEEEKAFIEQRKRLKVPQTGRTWTREELYDERLRRISH